VSNAPRIRRSKSELLGLRLGVQRLLDEEDGPISIRHLFYRAVAAGLIEKSERAYKNLQQQLTKWRRAGLIPWDAFSDSTRWHYGRVAQSSMAAYLAESVRLYRYDLWRDRDVYCEIWVEKDAIVPIVLEAADPWRVRVFPFRGFTSLTSLYTAAETFRAKQAEGKAVFVYYVGDHDPSGVMIDRAVTKTLRDDFDVDLTFERIAILPEQIREYDLPTRPTKRERNTHAKGFRGDSVEVDALPRAVLVELVETAITQHLPAGTLERLERSESIQRESAWAFLGHGAEAGVFAARIHRD
jgi:hypothetical protein